MASSTSGSLLSSEYLVGRSSSGSPHSPSLTTTKDKTDAGQATDSDSSHGDFTSYTGSSPSSTNQRVNHQHTSSSTIGTSGAIWSSAAATLAFHPTGGANSCGSLFGGSTSGNPYHPHHHQNAAASGAMAYLKSSPYAMNGLSALTNADLLHPGYPGE